MVSVVFILASPSLEGFGESVEEASLTRPV